MRNRKRWIYLSVLVVVFALGFGAFQAVGALTSFTTPKPKLETNLAEPGREAYQCSFVVNSTAPFNHACVVPPGPTGNQRLVIRSIDWWTLVPASGVAPQLRIDTKLGGVIATHYLASTDGGGNAWAGHSDLIMYADPGSPLVTDADNPSGSVFAQGVITGDLLDCNRLLTATITVDCNATQG
jgi:hypothetical protein